MSTYENIEPTKKALLDALNLTDEVLKNIELSEIPLENIALKVGRLARLLNNFQMQQIIEYEVSGYPTSTHGVPADIYNLAVIAGREYKKVSEKGTEEKYIYCNSITNLENGLTADKIALSIAKDPDVSISSSNPNQYIWNPTGNNLERNTLRASISLTAERISSRRLFLFGYVMNKHHELKFSNITEDIFTRIRNIVDENIGKILPDSVKKFNAVYDYLLSNNPEDWANGVNSCRRILMALADKVFPATNTIRQTNDGKEIKLGQDNYINRLMAFIEDSSDSERFRDIVGSHLRFIVIVWIVYLKQGTKGHMQKLKRMRRIGMLFILILLLEIYYPLCKYGVSSKI